MGIWVDSRPSIDIEIDGGEEAVEMESHIERDGSTEDTEKGDRGHGDSDEVLPAERVEKKIGSSG